MNLKVFFCFLLLAKYSISFRNETKIFGYVNNNCFFKNKTHIAVLKFFIIFRRYKVYRIFPENFIQLQQMEILEQKGLVGIIKLKKPL